MTKKLLPLMIGASMAGGMSTAAADLKLGGHIDTSVVNRDAELASSSLVDDTNFWCTSCSIGVSGHEDLGNGLAAIFLIDFLFDNTNTGSSSSDSTFTDRDQYVGLAGGFGQLTIGTRSTIYKDHGELIDPMYRTSVQARTRGLQSFLHSGAGEEGEGRAENTLRWDSVDYGGVKVGFTYTLDSDDAVEDNNPYGLGASYSNGGILGFVDYITNDGDSGSELEAWKLGGSFGMDAFSVFAQYEDIEADVADSDAVIGAQLSLDLSGGPSANLDGDIWHLGATYTAGNNTLYGAYGQGDFDIDSGSADLDWDSFTVGGRHAFSTQTSAYAAYSSADGDAGPDAFEDDIFTLGIKHNF